MATQLPKMSITPEMGGKASAGRFQFGSNSGTAFLVDTATGQTWEMTSDDNKYWSPIFFRDYGEQFDNVLQTMVDMIRREHEVTQSAAMTGKALQSLQSVASKFTDVAQQINHKVNGGTTQ